jgi:diguanylate cyclase (GGDEF)-like protein
MTDVPHRRCPVSRNIGRRLLTAFSPSGWGRGATLTRSMMLAVGVALTVIQAATTAYDVVSERQAISRLGRERGEAALDMLEAVHTQAMLNRLQQEDGDSAIATLNGAMDQFGSASHGVALWVVMGPKILEYQKSHGQAELESSRDDIDAEAVATSSIISAEGVDGALRVVRPIVLGRGSGAHQKCAACHTTGMGIRDGEVLGAYSASVDLQPEFAAWRASAWRQVLELIITTALTLGVIWFLLWTAAFRPLRRIAQATRLLAGGDTDVKVAELDRADEIGTVARALEVFRCNAVARREAEEALRRINTQFDAALNNMAQGMLVWDANLVVQLVNRRHAEITGIPEDEIRTGMCVEDVAQVLVRHGIQYGCEQGQVGTRIRELVGSRKVAHLDITMPSGAMVKISYSPMEGGGCVVTFDDVTEKRRQEEQITHLARHDGLTGLPNRTLFQERTERAVSRLERGQPFALFCLDLDHFKDVNDTPGHAVGDELLRAAADRLSACLREVDTAARLGGDEFAVLQIDVHDPENAAVLATRIIEAVGAPYEINGHSVVVGVSLGIAIAPDDGTHVGALLKRADMALYRAKAEGRGTFCFFAQEMDNRAQARRALVMDLRRAMASEDELDLYYQPLVATATGRVTGFEALIRWHHPERGLVSPADFVPIAEETGLIVPLGEWVLRRACSEAAAWPEPVKVAVNLSPSQFRNQYRNRHIAAVVSDALAASGLDPGRLELEVTETVLINDNEATLALLNELKRLGVRIALDDFGTGYSSLSYLRRFPFDKIKIDSSFIKDVAQDGQSTAIIRAITGLGTGLSMAITAEGVETEDQLATLYREGCAEIQGYLFSPPRPNSEVSDLLRRLNARTILDAAVPELLAV